MAATPKEQAKTSRATSKPVGAIRKLSSWYDKQMSARFNNQYYGGSDFWNFGLWDERTADQKEASANLVQKLLTFIPVKDGRILDVACGLGATTRQISRYYPVENITAINISMLQLARTLSNAPGANVAAMDAARLAFADASFDNIICVEAAFHFRTRDQFLREAFRVLKPGGRISLSDILMVKGAADAVKENYLKNPEALRESIIDIGFEDVRVTEATKECWGGFAKNMRRWPGRERKAGRISFPVYLAAKVRCTLYPLLAGLGMKNYVLISARKPIGS